MIKQLAIFIENQEGSFRRVTALLHEQNMNIYGFSTIDTPEFGILRMITDDPERSQEVLSQNGFVTRICEVIAAQIGDQLKMDQLLTVIHEGNVNINYMYSSFGQASGSPVIILHAADLEETEQLLKSKGFCCMDKIS